MQESGTARLEGQLAVTLLGISEMAIQVLVTAIGIVVPVLLASISRDLTLAY